MTTKGDRTRERIVARAATIFNKRGFAGTAIADVLEATGLEKGGLYRHFESKDALALSAFDYAVNQLSNAHRRAVQSARTPYDGLIAWIDAVAESTVRPPIPGGCPLLNTAVEADDTHPALRSRAAAAMREWQSGVAALVDRAIDAGQLEKRLDSEETAATIVASLEGAIMTTSLLRDRRQMLAVANHLKAWLHDRRRR